MHPEMEVARAWTPSARGSSAPQATSPLILTTAPTGVDVNSELAFDLCLDPYASAVWGWWLIGCSRWRCRAQPPNPRDEVHGEHGDFGT